MEIKVNVDDALVQETKDKCTVLVKLKTAIDKAKKSAAKFFAVEDLQLNASTQDKLNYAQNEYDAKASELADAVVTSILGYGLSDANNENLRIYNKPESYQQVKSDTENTDTEPKTLRELAKQQKDEQVNTNPPKYPESILKNKLQPKIIDCCEALQLCNFKKRNQSVCEILGVFDDAMSNGLTAKQAIDVLNQLMSDQFQCKGIFDKYGYQSNLATFFDAIKSAFEQIDQADASPRVSYGFISAINVFARERIDLFSIDLISAYIFCASGSAPEKTANALIWQYTETTPELCEKYIECFIQEANKLYQAACDDKNVELNQDKLARVKDLTLKGFKEKFKTLENLKNAASADPEIAQNDAQIVNDLPEDLNDDEPELKQEITSQPQKKSDLNKLASPIKAKSSKELLADLSRAFIVLKQQEMGQSNLTEDEALANVFYCLDSALAKIPVSDIFSYSQKLQKEANSLSGRFSGLCGSNTYNEFFTSFITLLTKLDEPKADAKAFMSCITHNVQMYRWNMQLTTAFIYCSCGANAEMVGKNLASALIPRKAKTLEEKLAGLDKNLKLFFEFATKGKQNLLGAELTETEKFKITAETHDIFNKWYAVPKPTELAQSITEEPSHAVLDLVSRIAKASKDDISKLQGEVRVKTIGRGGENEGFISDDHGLLMQAITDRQAEIKAQKDNPHSLLRHLMDFKSDEGLRIYYQIWLRLAKNEHSISYKALLDKAKALRNDADKKILTAQLNSLITATGEQ